MNRTNLVLVTFLSVLILSASLNIQAQIHCGSVSFEPNSAVTVDLNFDSFSKYQGGVIINNVGQLRINVEDQAIPDPDCRWFLRMEVNNNPVAGTAADRWETLGTYSSSGNPPEIDILEVRVRNNCQTSAIDGVFQTFSNNGDQIEIIPNFLPLTPAGSCALGVNGPGNYLANFNEYTFIVDVKVTPDFLYSPGIYQLSLRFHLEEQP